MYIPAFTVPAWLGALGWAAAAASLAAAVIRLRRNPPSWLGFAGAAAVVSALRLLEFPLGESVPFGASVVAVGFAVVVFGAEVAVCALAAATVATGVVAPHPDWAATGANLLVHAAAVPWVIGGAYVALKRVFPSRAAGYVLAFALGAAGAPLVALAAGIVAWAGGTAASGAAGCLLAAGMALTAAEGVLAAWGYALASSRHYEADGRAPFWAPRPWPGAFGLAVLALVVAAGIAPLVPVYGGALGPMPAWARAPALSHGGRVVAGAATAAAAAVFSSALYAVGAALRPRRRA
ncbi:MAG TPA: energy-coupling factor ABC transporter permease [bacterium]|nr:energy-coupling factor ABC transporter permease [bacterium]